MIVPITGAVGEIGQLGFDDLDAQGSDGFERLGVVGARGGVSPIAEIDGSEADA